MTKEIAQKDWQTFCQMLTEKYQDALVSIQLINGRLNQIALSTPLRSVFLDQQSGGCNNHIKIHLESTRYEILEPIHFILRKPNGPKGSESFHELEILSENGTTVITIHPGISAEHLAGISTGSLRSVPPLQPPQRIAGHGQIGAAP